MKTREVSMRYIPSKNQFRAGKCYKISNRTWILFLLLLFPKAVLAEYLRLVFPQVVVGDAYTSTIDLTNKGLETFLGDLSVGDDAGYYLPISINGLSVSGKYALNIPPGSVQRFRLTRSGPTVAGHAMVYDRRTATTIGVSDQINGTLVFQWKSGNTLLDSIGVPSSDQLQHFYFIAEYNGDTSTGIALSEPIGRTVTVTLRATLDSGQLIDSRILTLEPFNHQAFFVNQKLTVPLGFRGTVEVEATDTIGAIALRLEGTQYSAIPVLPFSKIYDFTITLSDGRTYRGEMTYLYDSEYISGRIRFTSPTSDNPSAIYLAGLGSWDLFSFFTATEFGKVPILVVGVPSFSPSESLSGIVGWFEPSRSYTGTFTATRRR